MICIFCQKNSDLSKTIEHIIPEALGNTEHILPKGIVCDSCNHYFGTKIEKKLLETLYFEHVRSRKMVQNKKGKIPPISGILLPARLAVKLSKDGAIYAANESDESIFVKSIQKHDSGQIIVPHIPNPPIEPSNILSKFLAKVALEVLAQRLMDSQEGLDFVAQDKQLHNIRQFARYGKFIGLWPYHQRRIYSEEMQFSDNKTKERYEVLHEYQLLYTDDNQQLYLILAIFGIEYAINFRNPSIDSYEIWLEANNNKSPLYP